MKFENKLFLQLDSQYKALFLCQKFIESIMYLRLLPGKYVYKNFQTALYARVMSNNVMSQIVNQVILFI